MSTGMTQGIYRQLMRMTPYDRYALPFVGSTFRSIDQYADYQKMYADYARNVGRQIKYPSIRDYRANAGSALSSGITSAISMPIKGAGKTVRSLI